MMLQGLPPDRHRPPLARAAPLAGGPGMIGESPSPGAVVMARLDALAEEGRGAAIADAVLDRDLAVLGAAALTRKVSTGASGLGLGLAGRNRLIQSPYRKVPDRAVSIDKARRLMDGVLHESQDHISGSLVKDRRRVLTW